MLDPNVALLGVFSWTMDSPIILFSVIHIMLWKIENKLKGDDGEPC